LSQHTFDFSTPAPVVDDYRARLLEQIKRDMQTLVLGLEGPEGREFYEQRIASYRDEVKKL